MWDTRFISFLRDMEPISHSYDYDGVVTIGIRPKEEGSVILTGRSVIDEKQIVYSTLSQERIFGVPAVLNPIPKNIRTRIHSAFHKAVCLFSIPRLLVNEHIHFDDDQLQIDAIRELIWRCSGYAPRTKCLFIENLVQEGRFPRNQFESVFDPTIADWLHDNLKFVHVECDWVEK